MNAMSRAARRLVVIFALAGLVSSGLSTYVHYRLVQEPGYLSFCDISATVSCTQVYLSRFGSVQGVPVALGGFVWFALVLLFGALGGRGAPEFRENLPAYLLAMSTLALATVLYLGYASFFVLKTLCLLCATVYVAVAGIFLVSSTSTSLPVATLPRRAWCDARRLVATPATLMVSVLFVAASASAVALFPRESPDEGATRNVSETRPVTAAARSEFERWWEAQPRVQLPVPDEGAAVLVVKFNDYQCPACRQTAHSYRRIFSKYRRSHPGAVTLVIKDYPLDPECNEDAPNGPHDAACEAAVAVRLARRNGRAERMEEWLYSNQESLSPASVRAAARDVGGVEDFEAEYARTLEQVNADIALGGTLDVMGTPAFFVNGVAIKGGLIPAYFDAAIAYELERSGNP